MFSLATFYLFAVVCSMRQTQALFPDSNLETQADFMQKLVSEVEDRSNTADVEQNIIPVLMRHSGGTDLEQDKFSHMVEDLKEVVLKLAAADKFRSHSFLRSEQNSPKTNKRACFWKYCVTN